MLFKVLGMRKDSLASILEYYNIKSSEMLLATTPEVVPTSLKKCSTDSEQIGGWVFFGMYYPFRSLTDAQNDQTGQKWLTFGIDNGPQITLLVEEIIAKKTE